MRKTEELEREVRKLGRSELAAFREWFYGYDSKDWDRQIEEDAAAGNLDVLARAALASHKAGQTKEL